MNPSPEQVEAAVQLLFYFVVICGVFLLMKGVEHLLLLKSARKLLKRKGLDSNHQNHA